MCKETKNFEKINAALIYWHVQNTSQLNNRLIDYCVSRLFNNVLVTFLIIDYNNFYFFPKIVLPVYIWGLSPLKKGQLYLPVLTKTKKKFLKNLGNFRIFLIK